MSAGQPQRAGFQCRSAGSLKSSICVYGFRGEKVNMAGTLRERPALVGEHRDRVVMSAVTG